MRHGQEAKNRMHVEKPNSEIAYVYPSKLEESPLLLYVK